jgi:hypothetical protein
MALAALLLNSRAEVRVSDTIWMMLFADILTKQAASVLEFKNSLTDDVSDNSREVDNNPTVYPQGIFSNVVTVLNSVSMLRGLCWWMHGPTVQNIDD